MLDKQAKPLVLVARYLQINTAQSSYGQVQAVHQADAKWFTEFVQQPVAVAWPSWSMLQGKEASSSTVRPQRTRNLLSSASPSRLHSTLEPWFFLDVASPSDRFRCRLDCSRSLRLTAWKGPKAGNSLSRKPWQRPRHGTNISTSPRCCRIPLIPPVLLVHL